MDTGPPTKEGALATEADEALIAKLVRQDENALRVVYARYAPLVFTVAARIVEPSAAEEVVQDVFLTVWRRAETFDPQRGSFKGWIVRIARHRALNDLRKRRLRIAGGDDALEQVADEEAMPDEAQWAAHRRAAVQKAIDALPASERQALSLAIFEELTHEQVASALRMPLGTAKTRIRLAMKRLAPTLLAMLAAIALVLAWRREERQQALEERALRLVTASDVVPIRLEAAPGVPPEAHGTYRAKTGTDIAVLTATNLPAPGAGERYVAWVRRGERWSPLGAFERGEEAERSMVVSQDPAVASPIDEVRVTRESRTEATPRGPAMLGWQSARP
jgi:RNA polymerase sigma-70 factor (ECF subfamily)